MSVVGSTGSSGLVARVTNILTKPAAEWDVIAAEPATVGSIYTGYACVLAAIPAIAAVIGGVLYRHSLIIAIVGGVLGYVLSLAGLYLIALIIDALASGFGGQKSMVQALKLAAYANTAGWVAGAGGILPAPLSTLIALLGGLYGLYLLYLGLPKLMKCPPEQTTIYFILVLVVAAVVYLVIGFLLGIVLSMFAVGAIMTGAAASSAFH